MTDPVSEVIKYLLGYGMPGLIAAYFAQQYLRSEKRLEELRAQYEIRLNNERMKVDALHDLRLKDWQEFGRSGVVRFESAEGDTPVFNQARLMMPRKYEMITPGPRE